MPAKSGINIWKKEITDMEKCNLLIKNAVVMTDYETVKNGMDIAV